MTSDLSAFTDQFLRWLADYAVKPGSARLEPTSYIAGVLFTLDLFVRHPEYAIAASRVIVDEFNMMVPHDGVDDPFAELLAAAPIEVLSD